MTDEPASLEEALVQLRARSTPLTDARIRELVDNADSDEVSKAVIALVDAYETFDDLDAHITHLVCVVLGVGGTP